MEMSLDCEDMDTTHSETLRIWGAIGMPPHESQLRALAKSNRYRLPYTRQSTPYMAIRTRNAPRDFGFAPSGS